MTQVINSNLIVDSTPYVIAATPAARAFFNGAVISRNEKIPIDPQTALVFTNAAAVGAYFGLDSDEYAYSQVYFKGFDKSTIKPSYLYFVRQADTAASAWIRGGSFTSANIVNGFSGTLTLTVDDETATTASITIPDNTTGSNAADLIDTALNAAFTATVECTFDSEIKAFIIKSGTTGTTSIVSFASGTIADNLKLRAVDGAIKSYGYAAETIEKPLVRLIDVALNWTTFTTIQATTDDERLTLAQWADASKDYRYICWDSDTDQVSSNDSTSFALKMNGIKDADGNYTTEPVYNLKYTAIVYNSIEVAMLLMGFCAAINTDPLRNGKWVNLAFLTQSGFTPTVYNTSEAEILISKGVSFYGNFATANNNHSFLWNGKEAGVFTWLQDSLADKKIRSDIAEGFINFAQARQNLPFNPETYQALTAYMDANVFQNALAIGMINANVDLDDGQKLALNDHFDNQNAAQNVFDRGFYFKAVPATSADRALRKATALYAYTTGGSIQTLKLDSYLVQ